MPLASVTWCFFFYLFHFYLSCGRLIFFLGEALLLWVIYVFAGRVICMVVYSGIHGDCCGVKESDWQWKCWLFDIARILWWFRSLELRGG